MKIGVREQRKIEKIFKEINKEVDFEVDYIEENNKTCYSLGLYINKDFFTATILIFNRKLISITLNELEYVNEYDLEIYSDVLKALKSWVNTQKDLVDFK